MDETTRLAFPIETFWPAVLVALTDDTNARTEGFNRIIKQTKRVGCELTNMDSYPGRIMVHIASPQGREEHEIRYRPAQVRRARDAVFRALVLARSSN
ncbi:hypothetical protein BA895_10605 [Humibacillus sp. DSM 29435]|uniref:hypothetical protein n=1 Tax=Humibacillus sp. DSM 29435 TaxID=1869167 RepID=UPI000872E1EB|nr:hypothetical protein [Humibacillus sp. DSM 29435]OFE14405.1 hypothetical protein BA895_10605 [Humibacillus sp. DSM 29435]